MSGNKLILALIAGTLAIIVGGAVLVSKMAGTPELKATNKAKVEIQETDHDWGEIGINDGNVNKSFKIKNTGSGILELAKVATSCMCTTAQVIIDNNKSPFFGMHSKSSWLGEVPAGEQAEVLVEFDPAFHGPNGVGQITRQVSLETNDPSNPKITFNLVGNVIK